MMVVERDVLCKICVDLVCTPLRAWIVTSICTNIRQQTAHSNPTIEFDLPILAALVPELLFQRLC